MKKLTKQQRESFRSLIKLLGVTQVSLAEKISMPASAFSDLVRPTAMKSKTASKKSFTIAQFSKLKKHTSKLLKNKEHELLDTEQFKQAENDFNIVFSDFVLEGLKYQAPVFGTIKPASKNFIERHEIDRVFNAIKRQNKLIAIKQGIQSGASSLFMAVKELCEREGMVVIYIDINAITLDVDKLDFDKLQKKYLNSLSDNFSPRRNDESTSVLSYHTLIMDEWYQSSNIPMSKVVICIDHLTDENVFERLNDSLILNHFISIIANDVHKHDWLTVVLSCNEYSFLSPEISQVLGRGRQIRLSHFDEESIESLYSVVFENSNPTNELVDYLYSTFGSFLFGASIFFDEMLNLIDEEDESIENAYKEIYRRHQKLFREIEEKPLSEVKMGENSDLYDRYKLLILKIQNHIKVLQVFMHDYIPEEVKPLTQFLEYFRDQKEMKLLNGKMYNLSEKSGLVCDKTKKVNRISFLAALKLSEELRVK